MIQNVIVRETTLSDIAGLAKVHVASWQAAYRDILPAESLDNLLVERYEAMWQRNLLDAQHHSLLLELESRIVGFVAFGASHDDANTSQTGELYALYLFPEMWGAGYGRALCGNALNSLKAKGFTEVMLWVLQNNNRARGFYERMGFLCDNTTKDVRMCGAELVAVRYRMKL